MADDFDLKYKRQEAGITDKKTGKTIPPFDKATQTLKKVARASTIGKAIAIPVALGTAAYEFVKDKRKGKESSSITDFDSPELKRAKLSEQGYSDEDISKKVNEETSGVQGKSKGGLVRFKKQYQMHNGKF